MLHKAQARIARPLLEFVQNFGFAHLLLNKSKFAKLLFFKIDIDSYVA